MAMQAIREERYADSETGRAGQRIGTVPERKLRRAYGESATGGSEVPGLSKTRRSGFGSGFRLTFRRGAVPKTTRGRVLAGVALVAGLGLVATAAYETQKFLLHDERFVIPASSSIQIEGNSHLTRAQLLSVFGEDVERNVFNISLADRREELERLPWVAHATVMRLLPNRLRVSIVERTPVAFVRQGSQIGLVDKNGVLLDMVGDSASDAADSKDFGKRYSFPVVTGISADEPLSVRAARMKIFERFTGDLDSTNENISARLSEVDLSNPEDVKALIPDQATEIMVHFGETDFLQRYRKFEEQLPGWRTQYPKLASADMRYERQVVLEMQQGAAIPVAGGSGEVGPAAHLKAPAKAVAHPVTAHPVTAHPVTVHPVTVHPVTVHPVTVHPVTVHPVTVHPVTVHPVTVHPAVAKAKSVFGSPHFPDAKTGR
ncbi:Cell division protein FtsQ [Granulicella sibirica]|uniref:Cell division protein FtsQ n=2 Tax=Granulicella sibirica TaxID=2479048 RepID=A0A4Q0SY09_9BACT|nr:Cell division protein FtsQ [Granulicella sibirica]